MSVFSFVPYWNKNIKNWQNGNKIKSSPRFFATFFIKKGVKNAHTLIILIQKLDKYIRNKYVKFEVNPSSYSLWKFSRILKAFFWEKQL